MPASRNLACMQMNRMNIIRCSQFSQMPVAFQLSSMYVCSCMDGGHVQQNSMCNFARGVRCDSSPTPGMRLHGTKAASNSGALMPVDAQQCTEFNLNGNPQLGCCKVWRDVCLSGICVLIKFPSIHLCTGSIAQLSLHTGASCHIFQSLVRSKVLMSIC